MPSVRTVKAIVLDGKSDIIKVIKTLNSNPSDKALLNSQLDSAIRNLTSAKNLIGESEQKKPDPKTAVQIPKPEAKIEQEDSNFSF